MNIAIFGCNGYLGRHLSKHFCRCGFSCKLFDLQEGSFSGGDYCQCDVTSKDWWSAFDPRQFDAVVFLSGLSGPERSFKEAGLYESINVGGMLNLLQTLAPMGEDAPKIIFPSSRLVYRGGGKVAEDAVLEPCSVYAANKVACEGLLSAYGHRYGLHYVVLRICVPYGNLISKDYSYGTLGAFMEKVRAGRPITIYGDGSLRRTYTHILDICDIFRLAVEKSVATGIYNVGGFDYSLREVAEMIAKSHAGEVAFVPWPEEAKRVDMGDISMDAEKLAKEIGFSRYRRMEDSVNEF